MGHSNFPLYEENINFYICAKGTTAKAQGTTTNVVLVQDSPGYVTRKRAITPNALSTTNSNRYHRRVLNQDYNKCCGWVPCVVSRPDVSTAPGILSQIFFFFILPPDDGKLYTFGENEFGKLGLSDTNSASVPQHVSLIKDRVRRVSCGNSHTAAVTGKLTYMFMEYYHYY